MIANKVCPVVLRHRGLTREVLAFEHPQAGCQVVKGTIEPGESVQAAALRELAEESGVRTALITRHLGIWSSGDEDQVWAFVECVTSKPLPDSWSHHVADDGGHTFKFFWHPLTGQIDEGRWHPLFQRALAFLERAA